MSDFISDLLFWVVLGAFRAFEKEVEGFLRVQLFEGKGVVDAEYVEDVGARGE